MGVRLEGRGSKGQDGEAVIRARRGVISNASVWDTQALLPAEGTPPGWRREALSTPRTGSFMHLHLGEGLGFMGLTPMGTMLRAHVYA